MRDKDQHTHQNKNYKGIILLISDSKKINNPLIKQLLPNGYKVIVAHDAFDAFKKLRSLKIDLIITRLKFPTMDCLELIMNLKDLNIDSPVIIIEENDKEQMDKSFSIVDVCAYCYSPRIRAKMIETINLITR